MKKRLPGLFLVLVLVVSVGVYEDKGLVYHKQRGTKNQSVVYNKNGRNL